MALTPYPLNVIMMLVFKKCPLNKICQGSSKRRNFQVCHVVAKIKLAQLPNSKLSLDSMLFPSWHGIKESLELWLTTE